MKCTEYCKEPEMGGKNEERAEAELQLCARFQGEQTFDTTSDMS